jgi:peptide/nickel transport system substrate-binding protein
VARARALVQESGTAAVPIRVVLPPTREAAAKYIASVLTSLGYRHVTWEVTKPDQNYSAIVQHDRTVSVGVQGWQADFPAASAYYLPLFQCGAGFMGWYCDHTLDAKVDRALATQFSDPSKAQSLWEDVYRTIADRAVVIPYGTQTVDWLVSRRANANYQSGWFNGPLLDQMWVQ